MSLGTPGAPGQSCTMAQFLCRVLAAGDDLAPAVAAPRWSVNLKGAPIVENAISETIFEQLHIDDGHFESEKVGWMSFGSLKAVVRKHGKLLGVADRRRVADVAGY